MSQKIMLDTSLQRRPPSHATRGGKAKEEQSLAQKGTIFFVLLLQEIGT